MEARLALVELACTTRTGLAVAGARTHAWLLAALAALRPALSALALLCAPAPPAAPGGGGGAAAAP